MSHKHVICR